MLKYTLAVASIKANRLVKTCKDLQKLIKTY